jgi:hypothetical protein
MAICPSIGNTMAEDLKKFLLYFRSTGSILGLSPDTIPIGDPGGPLGEYPIDLVPKLTDGHFTFFDNSKLPLRLDAKGVALHRYPALCTFAFAQWGKYLRTADLTSLQMVETTAEYICRTADRSISGMIMLRSEIPGKGHVGLRSAMFHGEAISVLCRAYQVFKKNRYLKTAEDLVHAYTVAETDGGVLGCLDCLPWYEEYPENTTKPHVLNGMVSALWGLRDLHLLTGNAHCKKLFDLGVESVSRAVRLFDTGRWSLYAFPGDHGAYPASMKYHIVNTLDLRALGRQTDRSELLATADRFEGYAQRARNRMLAGFQLGLAKIKLKAFMRSGTEIVHQA